MATRGLAQFLNQPKIGEQIEIEFIAIYGMGLEGNEVLNLNLEEIQEIKTRLEKSLEIKGNVLREDEKKRIKNAILEQENEIKRLEKLESE